MLALFIMVLWSPFILHFLEMCMSSPIILPVLSLLCPMYGGTQIPHGGLVNYFVFYRNDCL